MVNIKTTPLGKTNKYKRGRKRNSVNLKKRIWREKIELCDYRAGSINSVKEKKYEYLMLHVTVTLQNHKEGTKLYI